MEIKYYEKTQKPVKIQDFYKEFKRIIEKIPQKDIKKAVDILFEAWKNEKTVFAIGCGGSASTATHFACDLSKSTILSGHSIHAKRFKAMAMVDNIPLISAWTNDNGWASVFLESLRAWLKEGDVLVVFSVHGGTTAFSSNLEKAMDLALTSKAKIIGFAGFDGGAIKEMADVAIIVPIDEEPLATPIIESAHVMLHHLVCSLVKEKLNRHRKKEWKK